MAAADVIARRFALIERVAQGGMGTVFRATDLETSKTVAVKVLGLDQPFDVVRFGREAAMIAALHHPNVVDYVAHGEADGVRYIVQGWVDGITLEQLTRTQGATAREAIAVGAAIASALHAIHAQGMIHRDVKPANIILTDGDPARAVLVDFGIARLEHETGVLTRAGAVLGTPSFMSPEQARGSIKISAAADVWALGCVLYEMLSGRVAFAGKTPIAIRAKLLVAEPKPLGPLCPEAPPALLTLVGQMLRKEVALRPQHGGEVVDRLLALSPVPAGPRRVVGAAAGPTLALPVQTRERTTSADANSYVLISTAEPGALIGLTDRLVEVAAMHQLDFDVLEDGSALLTARQPGKAGAISATRAGIALRTLIPDGALSVFGRAHADDTLDSVVDRGAELLDQATVVGLFGDAEGEGMLLVDDVVADLVREEVELEHTPHGNTIRRRS